MKNKKKSQNLFNSPVSFGSFAKKSKSGGVSLLEGLLVIIITFTVIVGVYAYYRSVSAAEAVHRESQAIAEMTKRISSAYNSMPDFSGITSADLIKSGAIPSNVSVENSRIYSGFGSEILIASEGADEFSITYQNIPKRVCQPLVTSINSVDRFREINVNSHQVARGGSVIEDALASACADKDIELEIIYSRIPTAGIPSLGDCTLPSPSTQNRSLSCSPGYAGEIIEERSASCPSPSGLPVWSDWTVESDNCEIICIPHPTSPETRVVSCDPDYVGSITERRESVCASYTGPPSWSDWEEVSNTCELRCSVQIPNPNEEYRIVACPSGYHGTRTERRTFSCPTVTGTPLPSGWSVHEDNCEVLCNPLLPVPNPQTRWLYGEDACPVDYSGSITYEYEQSKTWTCPAGSPSVGQPIEGNWVTTGNRRNINNTCTPNCTPDAPLERWVNKTTTCPDGSAGTISFQQKQVRTSVCNPGQKNPVTSSWQDVQGETRNQVNGCTSCPSSQLETDTELRWSPYNAACSNNQFGTIERERQQRRIRTRTGVYNCPPGTISIPPISWGDWSNWGNWTNTGQDKMVKNNCAGCPADKTETTSETRWNGTYETNNCSAGQYGYTVRERQQRRSASRIGRYLCPAGTTDVPEITWGEWVWGNWSNTGTTRQSSTECKNCPGPKTETDTDTSWQAYESNNCSAGQYGYSDRERERVRTRTRTGTYNCPAGTKTLPSISWGSWSGWSGWSNTGTTRQVKRNCSNCGTPPQLVQTRSKSETSAPRWVNGTGTNDCRQYEQTRVRTGTERRTRNQVYNCPAGTRTRPAPTPTGSWSAYTHVSWNSWGAYSNTGNTRNRSGHTGSETRDDTSCPMGQYLVAAGMERRSYTCSGGNRSWGAWTRVSFPQCCREGMNCQIQ